MAPDAYSPLNDYYRDRGLPSGIHNPQQTASDPRMYDAGRLGGRGAID